ncbi:MAG: ABC transporter ATP-binding protein/permease [Burkholderiales bacterium]|nr:ABC transporter ATP-binding protein/permease [Burkholderiales bacterium]
MRHFASSGEPSPVTRPEKSGWATVATLIPYLLEYKGRVALALTFLLAAKLANVGVPLIMKEIVDGLGVVLSSPEKLAFGVIVGLLVAYGAARLSTTIFTELREFVFAKVTQSAVRRISLQVFRHLHSLSLRFHLNRQTGGMTRDIERGSRGVSSLVSYTLYSILPTLLEISLVLGILAWKYDAWFVIITVAALACYILWSIAVTEWRTNFRRTMNDLDSKANVRAIDSLLNYETVKYFNNEEYEARRYDQSMARWEAAAVKSQTSLSLLNTGQSAIIAVAVTAIMWRATVGVANGSMTLGDLVLVNAFMIQLYIPLNFLGVLYREIKQSLADMERMFTLLDEHREVADRPGAPELKPQGAAIRFEHVDFSYEPNRQILFDVDFEVPAGKTVAVVGHSGSGKSTLARLLYRFYDVNPGGGSIRIDGQDLREVTQGSLRRAIGIVPQDTVLFNDTIYYNVAYGDTTAAEDQVHDAARMAAIHDFVLSLPAGYQTMVGERGLKLSGGEKQRVAIARALLKNPAIMIFDEATSALDSQTEKAIQAELKKIAENRTTLVIAHRLSTIADAHQIIVMDGGRIVERGGHLELLERGGHYAQMWALQQQEEAEPAPAAAAAPASAPALRVA